MRKCAWLAWILLMWLATSPVAAQETRGTISGTVRDKDGVLPGADVKITNTGTNVTQQLVTNASGYFEATGIRLLRGRSRRDRRSGVAGWRRRTPAP